MGEDARQTVDEIEKTREELARKVDEFVDRAKVEASQLGKKAAVGAAALAGLVLVGWFAKKRVQDD
ncbi:MAG: DUF3618 domain-containing protein [Actinomycetota bacterium]